MKGGGGGASGSAKPSLNETPINSHLSGMVPIPLTKGWSFIAGSTVLLLKLFFYSSVMGIFFIEIWKKTQHNIIECL